ncbi:MAG: lipoic acid synthetase, partial [Zhongshania sp.]
MSDSKLIPSVQIHSGEKFINEHGVRAIKDGIKAANQVNERLAKPDWLRIKVKVSDGYKKVAAIVSDNKLATVCEEAKCPNLS